MENIKINNLKYDSNGLIPTVVQDGKTKEILMVAYSNKESLEMTIKNKFGYFWSRSKNKLWKKGETCLLDIHIMDTDAKSYASSLSKKVLEKAAKDKKDKYVGFIHDALDKPSNYMLFGDFQKLQGKLQHASMIMPAMRGQGW